MVKDVYYLEKRACMNLLEITAKDRILIIAPHPDDECIGPGGLLALYSKQCEVLVLTDGGIGQGDLSADICREVRKKEFIIEMNILGISKYNFLKIPDGMLMRNLDCLKYYDLGKYTKIFVTNDKDGHTDHTAAFLCLMKALTFQENSKTFVFMYEVHRAQECPTDYLKITQVIEKKKELVRCHRSQLSKIPYDEFVQVQASYRALQNRMPNEYIEVYTRISMSYEVDRVRMNLENDLQKYRLFYYVLTKWLMLEDDRSIFNKMNISSCAIYGYAELGKILERVLLKNGIKVGYILDKNIKITSTGNKIFYPGDEPNKEQTIIVTAIYYFDSIKKELIDMGYLNVISLKDIIENA